MSKSSQDYKHIKRLLIVVVIIFIGFIAIRFFFVPKDFYRYGHYRGGSIAENMGRPLKYAGSAVCKDCHEERAAIWANSRHHTVNCENCHGALLKHSRAPSVRPAKPAGRKFCLLCHAYNITKPKTFPQIKPADHNPGQICWECHNPHDPHIK